MAVPGGPVEKRESFRESWLGQGMGMSRGDIIGFASCRTPWMLIPVARITHPAPWPAMCPWKPHPFWSGQGFS